ncbi:putative Autotransporter [Pseudomonas syringae pv. broussonetiae]|uniref:Putative Autotransporter n=2 Tax=Pseudomonas syringae group genomosp. 2 TaxID=251698 RepID=A0A3M5JBW6_PSESS|nr:putative Autotransporter [Pseudomonas syringae pv. broussonetiae]KPY00929.1 putative Autotransporter [Pseudomonas amygdali pv. mori]RMS28803.1 putative Autotransporter [Pseudomonas savastanoi]RMT20444.1 putative Autotransporter [Pseudomonas savastanoi]
MKDASTTRHTSVKPLGQAIHAINRASCGALACYLATLGVAHAAPYVEAGQAGNAASWRSAEFNADWGLGAINADQAYAAGYSGKGIKLGIFDQPVYAPHPEFSSANKVINLVTSGIREYTDPYIPVKAGDAFRYDGAPDPCLWKTTTQHCSAATRPAAYSVSNSTYCRRLAAFRVSLVR